LYTPQYIAVARYTIVTALCITEYSAQNVKVQLEGWQGLYQRCLEAACTQEVEARRNPKANRVSTDAGERPT
jgi:hypothetical protein